MNTADFYDRMAPFYHLIFPHGFEASIERHAKALDALIRGRWGDRVKNILDVSCGIGTQALGLAQLGYQVTASDLSPQAIARARQEAATRALNIDFSVADMRQAYEHHGRQFDVVLSADNALPHLLSDNEILRALGQFFRCCKPGGGCVVTVRDYEREDLTGRQVIPYGLRVEGGVRFLVFQTREYHGPIYDVAMYFVRDEGTAECATHVMRTRYYAIGAHQLMALMQQAGFQGVQKLDDVYFQPAIVGTRPRA